MSEEEVIRVGDVMRWSAELLAQTQAETGMGVTRLIRVVKIETNSDGTKTVWMQLAAQVDE